MDLDVAMMYGMLLSLKNEIVKIAPKGRVNCVAPGWVKTPMAADALKNPDTVYRAMATYVQVIDYDTVKNSLGWMLNLFSEPR